MKAPAMSPCYVEKLNFSEAGILSYKVSHPVLSGLVIALFATPFFVTCVAGGVLVLSYTPRLIGRKGRDNRQGTQWEEI